MWLKIIQINKPINELVLSWPLKNFALEKLKVRFQEVPGTKPCLRYNARLTKLKLND